MKKIINVLLALTMYAQSTAMDNKPIKKRTLTNATQSKPKRRKKISPFKKLAYPVAFANFINKQPKPIKYYGGKKRKQKEKTNDVYQEIIDLRTKAAILNEPFYRLIKERTEQNEPYFLAAILVEENVHDKKTKQVIKKLGRHYHDAAYLIEWIFNNDFSRKPERKDPVTSQHILAPIQFFSIEKLNGELKHFASEFNLRNSTQEAQYMCALIKSSMEKPQDILHLASSYHFGHGTTQNYKKAKKYYNKSKKQGYLESVNGLGDLYLDQQKYTKAEAQYLQSANKKDTYGQLNLVYLFEIGKSTLTLLKSITYFYDTQNNIGDFHDYTEAYPERWKIIKNAMEQRNIEIPDLQPTQSPFSPLNNDDFPPLPSDEESEEENEESNYQSSDIEMQSFIELPNDESEEEENENQEVNSEETTPLLQTLANTALEHEQENNTEHNQTSHTPNVDQVIENFAMYAPANNIPPHFENNPPQLPNNEPATITTHNTQQNQTEYDDNDGWGDIDLLLDELLDEVNNQTTS